MRQFKEIRNKKETVVRFLPFIFEDYVCEVRHLQGSQASLFIVRKRCCKIR